MEVGTVLSTIGKAISIAQAIWRMYQEMKELQKARRVMQSQLSVLMDILRSIESDESLRNPKVYNEVQKALENLNAILEEVLVKCSSYDLGKAIKALKSFEDTGLLEKIKQVIKVGFLAFFSKGKTEKLRELDQQLKLALSIVQMAFSCIQVKQLHRLEAQLTAEFQRLNFVDSTTEVYENPAGVPPKCVESDSVKAEVSNQRLIVSWKDKGSAPKYEVRYLENTYLHVTSAETSVAIGSQRIKPWQNYAIQVRAVNDAGASPWSFPPFYIRMTEGPSSRPTILTVESNTYQSLKVFADKPPNEQGVLQVIIEWRAKSGTQWTGKTLEVDKDDEYTIQKLRSTETYMIRIRYQNKFDVSEPSAEVPVKIKDMFSTEPREISVQSYSKNAVTLSFKPPLVNPGAVDHYLVQVGGKSHKIEGGSLMNGERASLILPDIQIDQLETYDVKVSAIAKNISGTVEVKGRMKREVKEVPASIAMTVALSHRIKFGVLEPFPFKVNALTLANAELAALRFETPFAEETVRSTPWTYETLEITEPTISTTFTN